MLAWRQGCSAEAWLRLIQSAPSQVWLFEGMFLPFSACLNIFLSGVSYCDDLQAEVCQSKGAATITRDCRYGGGRCSGLEYYPMMTAIRKTICPTSRVMSPMLSMTSPAVTKYFWKTSHCPAVSRINVIDMSKLNLVSFFIKAET